MPLVNILSYLERHQPEKNMHRYYRLYVLPTLFGQFALVREWGRIGWPGQTMENWFNTIDEARLASERLANKKHRKGYRKPTNSVIP